MGTRCVASAAASGMSEDHGNDEQELRRLRSEVAAQRRDIHALDDLEHRQEELIARLREEAAVREGDLAALRERLAAAEHELEDLRAIRDALTPPELPRDPGLELAAAFLPAIAEQVSGACYLVAEGLQDSTVLVGDVGGHGLQAARRAAFIRTTFAATAPFSDDPCRLLSWANTALIERQASASSSSPPPASHSSRASRSCAGLRRPSPALWLDDGHELIAPTQGTPLGLGPDPGFVEGSQRATAGAGVLLYTDGLTEARHDDQMFGLDGVSAALGGLRRPSPTEAIAVLRSRVADFAYGTLTDDLCLLAARIT
jgi:serine phosphatase RsbU (regulator of sigma subunit)